MHVPGNVRASYRNRAHMRMHRSWQRRVFYFSLLCFSSTTVISSEILASSR